MSEDGTLAQVIAIRGPATAQDVAAVVTVLSALTGPPPAEPAERNRWGAPEAMLRGRPPEPGPHAWRDSAW